ncbi:MAG: glycosyltransferase family 39 protein [Chloroflexota bacterium]
MSLQGPKRVALSLCALVLANLIIFFTQITAVQTLAAFLLTTLLPGFLLLSLLPLRHSGPHYTLQHLVIGLGLGYAIAIAGILFLHYLPGPITRTRVAFLYDMAIMSLLAARYLTHSQEHTLLMDIPHHKALLGLVIILAIAFFFRFFSLEYAEFQGDEVAVLHKAAACIQGREDTLFLHKKGPAEILLPTGYYALARRTNEWAARFPFSLANLIGVLTLYALGQAVLSRKGAWWAALLVALNGFFVAFGRIVQYQSLVFLFSTLGILAALGFARGGESQSDSGTRPKEHTEHVLHSRRVNLYLTAVFLAMGLLAHTDAVFAVITSAFIILKAAYQRHHERVTLPTLTALLGPILLAGALLASFYVPFALHPQFDTTQGYLKQRMGVRPPYNNLNVLLNLGSVYNAIYYLVFLALVLAWALIRHITRRKATGWAILVSWGALSATRLLFPSIWCMGERDLTGLLFILPIIFSFVTAREDLGWQLALVWFGVPFLIYMFGFREPRTHIYTFFPGAALLAAGELDRPYKSPWKTWLVCGGSGIILLLSAAYLHITFISHTPEYKRTYPEHRIPFFWTPYGEEMPQHGLFGFPYRAGWKAVGQLYASGALEGDYGTNEETHITRWYTRGEYACQVQPHYYFVAENVQDEQAVPMYDIQSDYTHFGTVWVGDTRKMRLYEKGEARLPYRDYQAAEAETYFDRELTDPHYPTGLPPQDPTSHIQQPMDRKLGQNVEFLGYDIKKTRICPGDTIVLTLYWRALGKMTESYTVFTHVADSGGIWAQKDHPPSCGNNPTDEWEPGHVYVDPYVIVTDSDMPSGTYPLLAGMYRFDTGERLPVSDAEGTQLGHAMELGTITVLDR